MIHDASVRLAMACSTAPVPPRIVSEIGIHRLERRNGLDTPATTTTGPENIKNTQMTRKSWVRANAKKDPWGWPDGSRGAPPEMCMLGTVRRNAPLFNGAQGPAASPFPVRAVILGTC